MVTDEAGAVVERLAYDAWGKRRHANGTSDAANAIRPAIDRGYTGHEHLDEAGFGLIHMNGRIYDPALGRFTAPDPLVQAPGFSQSYNRYSYVWNNPLKYVDLSGYQVSAVTPITYFEWIPGSDGVLRLWQNFRGPDGNMVDGTLVGRQIFGLSDNQLGLIAPGQAGSGASQFAYGNTIVGLGGSGSLMLTQSSGLNGTTASLQTAPTNSMTTFTSSGFSSTSTWIATSGGGSCTTSCTVSGVTVNGGSASGGNAGASSGGTFGGAIASLGTGFLNLLPGAALMNSAVANFDVGNYGTAGLFFVGALGDAAAGILTQGASSAVRSAVGLATKGVAGRFADLAARAVKGDRLTPHHMPQAAAGFTNRADGGALMLPEAEHTLTRTYGFKGAMTAQQEAGMAFRDVLARDVRDVRNIGGSQYNQGLRDLLDYYRTNFPELMLKK